MSKLLIASALPQLTRMLDDLAKQPDVPASLVAAGRAFLDEVKAWVSA